MIMGVLVPAAGVKVVSVVYVTMVGECPEPSEAVKVKVTSETVTTDGVNPPEPVEAVPVLEGCPSPGMVRVKTDADEVEEVPETVDVRTDRLDCEAAVDPDPPEGVYVTVKGDTDGFAGVTVSVKRLGTPEEPTDRVPDGPADSGLPYPEAVLVGVPGGFPEPLKL
jgi:hypothetical protein